MIGKISGVTKEWGMQPKKDGGQFGPAMLAAVELENGEEATVWLFEEKPIGEELELEKKGAYWNLKRAPKAKSNDYDEVFNKLFETINQGLEALDSRMQSIEDTLTEVAATLGTTDNKEPLPTDEDMPVDFLEG